MPAAILAVAGAAISGAIGTATIGATLLGALVSTAFTAAGSLLFKAKPPSLNSKLPERSEMVKQAITHRKLVYGRCRVSGPLVFIETNSAKVLANPTVASGFTATVASAGSIAYPSTIDFSYSSAFNTRAINLTGITPGYKFIQNSSVKIGNNYFTLYPSTADGSGNVTLLCTIPVSGLVAAGDTLVHGGEVLNADENDDAAREYLHLVIPLAAHEIDAVESVYFDDELVWTSSGGYTAPTWSTWSRITPHLGADDQAADSDLVAESASWTTEHRLRGTAYLYVRLRFNPQDVYKNGIPNISAIIRGKKCYDPRTSTTVWTDNPVICIRDYLTDARNGFGATSAQLNDTFNITQANICDELVTLADGSTEGRYKLNGVVDLDAEPGDILEQMLTSMGGYVTAPGGQFHIHAAAYVTPTVTLDEDDLSGPIKLTTKPSRRDLFNAVKGVFASIQDNYVLTDYPAIISETYAAADGETVYRDLDLPFTTSATMAQRLAKIALLKSRQEITVFMPCKLSALGVKVGDTVLVNNDHFGWSGKAFEVDNASISVGTGGVSVDLLLREVTSAVYDWTSSEELDFLASTATNLPNAHVVNAPGLSLSDEVRIINQVATTVLIADISTSSRYVERFEVQARALDSNVFVNMGFSSGTRFELINARDGALYEVRARAVNAVGAKSDWVTASRTIVGKTAPPSDVAGFSVNVLDGMAHLTWDAVPDADLSHYFIRFSPDTSGATWANAIDVASKVARPATSWAMPALIGTYLIKAYDTVGNISVNAASAVSLIDAVTGLSLDATITEHTAFSGSKTDTAEIDGTLQLVSGVLIDDVDDIDAVEDWDTLGGDIVASGEYAFASYHDNGSAATKRVISHIKLARSSLTSTVDARDLAIDEWPDFDDYTDDAGDVSAAAYIALTNDNPASSPTWGGWTRFTAGDYTARAYKFKTVLTSDNVNATPVVSQLSVSILSKT